MLILIIWKVSPQLQTTFFPPWFMTKYWFYLIFRLTPSCWVISGAPPPSSHFNWEAKRTACNDKHLTKGGECSASGRIYHRVCFSSSQTAKHLTQPRLFIAAIEGRKKKKNSGQDNVEINAQLVEWKEEFYVIISQRCHPLCSSHRGERSLVVVWAQATFSRASVERPCVYPALITYQLQLQRCGATQRANVCDCDSLFASWRLK